MAMAVGAAPIPENAMSFRLTIFAATLLAMTAPAAAQVEPFPSSFQTAEVPAGDATIHVRVGGKGPAVVLLHGYGETGDMWAPMAADLARDHLVIVPDLRGLGLSSKPPGGYDKKTQAGDLSAVLNHFKVKQVDLVTHDLGNMVGFEIGRASCRDRVCQYV